MPFAGRVIPFALLVACQPLQLAWTLNVLVPPSTGKFWLVGVMLNAQLAPAWATVTVCSAMDNAPIRGMADRLASAMKVTLLPGAPETSDVMCSQGVWVVAE